MIPGILVLSLCVSELAGFFLVDDHQPCIICGDETHWVEMNFGAFLHPKGCVDILDMRIQFDLVEDVMPLNWETM